jgi:hypothetical protein
MQYLLLFHCSNGYVNTLQCYVIHACFILLHNVVVMSMMTPMNMCVYRGCIDVFYTNLLKNGE